MALSGDQVQNKLCKNQPHHQRGGKMIYKDFDDFLMNVFTEETNLLDDDIPDGFEDWIVEQDVESIMRLAELYGKQKFIEGKKSIYSKRRKYEGS